MPKRRIDIRKEAAHIDRLRRGFERKLESRLKRLFTNSFRATADAFLADDDDLGLSGFASELSKIMSPHYRQVVETFGRMVLDQRQLKFDFDDLSQQYIAQHGGRSIKNISTYTREVVQRVIANGQKEGLSQDNIAQQLIDRGLGFSRRRAATIARTETGNASSWATHQMNKEFMPPDTLKQWVSANDARTRSGHAVMNGKQVPIDDFFEVPTNGEIKLMRYPNDYRGGPHNVINCRCVLIYVTPDDDVTLPEKPQDDPVVTGENYSEQPWVYREGLKPKFDIDHSAFGIPRAYREENYNPRDSYLSDKFIRAQENRIGTGMTHDETALIYNYTTGSYKQINGAFRGWYKDEDWVSKTDRQAGLGHHNMFRDAIEKLPPYKGSVARGVSDSVERRLLDYGVEVGATIRSEAYWSTSYNPKKKFDKRLVFVINSQSGRAIDDFSEYPHETEVIFPAGAEFKITKLDDRREQGGKYYVYMDEVASELSKSDNISAMDIFVTQMERATEYVDKRFEDKLDDQSDLFSIDNQLITNL